MGIAQISRITTGISTSSTGTWTYTSGSDFTAIGPMMDEMIRDLDTTELITPNSSPNTHIWEGKFGANWNGAPLARPFDNTSMHIQLDYKGVVSAMDMVVKLYEGATLRETKDFGSVASTAGTYNTKYWNVASATVDAITDFTDLRLRVESTQNAVNEREGFSYADLRMGAPYGPSRGLYTESFAGLSEMRACWTSESSGATPDLPPTVGSNRVDPNASIILVCHAHDLPANCYAKVTYATGFDDPSVGMGAFVRLNEAALTPGTDSWRYNMVNNSDVGVDRWELKYDGVASSDLDTEDYTSVAAPVATDTNECRAVGSTISGRKNGTQITSATDTQITAAGWSGIVFRLVGATKNGASAFEMGSIPNVHPALLPSNMHRRN